MSLTHIFSHYYHTCNRTGFQKIKLQVRRSIILNDYWLKCMGMSHGVRKRQRGVKGREGEGES